MPSTNGHCTLAQPLFFVVLTTAFTIGAPAKKIDMTTGIVSTVLGNGQRASNGDGGPAAEASTLMPDALCFDAHDNMYVGEKSGFLIRRVDGLLLFLLRLLRRRVLGRRML